jgi:hypothetical protein
MSMIDIEREKKFNRKQIISNAWHNEICMKRFFGYLNNCFLLSFLLNLDSFYRQNYER